MASMRFKAWLHLTLGKIVANEPYDKKEAEERIDTYLRLRLHGYSRQQALEIMDLYMEEEEDA